MKYLVSIVMFVFGGYLNAQNPMFKMNILKTNAIYYIKQPSYGHYTQDYRFGNGFLDVSIEKRNIHKNYIGIGINLQGRNYTLNYPIVSNAGRRELYKTNFGCSFLSYYFKYNFRIDSGNRSNTFVSFAFYFTREHKSKSQYYYDSIPTNIYMEQNRNDHIDGIMVSPVIGINNEYRLGDFVFLRSGIEFIPSGSGGRGFKNDSRLSINFGIQLRFY